MRLPALLLRFLPFWSYICPRCKREVPRNSHECPYCGERYGKPLRVPPLCLRNKEALEKYVHEKIFPRISAKQRDYLAQYFTTLFEDGFESGDFSAWSGTSTAGGSIEVTTANPKSGSYNARANITGTGTRKAYCYKSGFDESIIHVRLYVQFHDALPETTSDSITILYVRNKANTAGLFQVGIGYSNSRWLGNYRKAGVWTAWNNASYTASLDTWYCIEAAYYVHATEGYFKVWLDENLIYEDTNIDTSQNGNAGEVRVGVYGSSLSGDPSHTVDIDCVVVADTYIGEEGGVTEVQISDSASGNETFSRPYRGLSLIDQASGQDIFSRPYREFPILESTLGQELLLKTRNLSLSDIAASLEVIQKGKQLGAITDVAQGLEQILKQRLISLLDQAAGFESVARPTRVIVMADEALGREILSKLREVAAIADSAIGVEYINVGAEEAKKTKIFLLIGDLAIQVTGD